MNYIWFFIQIFVPSQTIMQEEEILKWYVVGIKSVRQEIKIRDRLRLAGMESYVPMVYLVKRVHGQQIRKPAPAITGLVFVHTSINAFKAYVEESKDIIYLRRWSNTKERAYLTIDNQEMERFIAFTTTFSENITYFKPSEVTLHEGELVEITLGSKTYEAEIKRVEGKRGKKLVVEIPDVTTAMLTVTPELMKLITKKSDKNDEALRQQRERSRQKKLAESGKNDDRRSRNIELDKKVLFDTAFRLLFVIPDQYQQEAEYHLAMNELSRIRQRLLAFKGVLPALEGELALALYLSSVKMNTDVEQATERLRNAIKKLKGNSMLRMRMEFFLAKLSGDAESLETILKETKKWNKLRLSPRQQAFMEEIKIVSCLPQ